jgi:hypothetical protein
MTGGVAGTLAEIAKLGILGLFLALFVTLYLMSLKSRREERKQFDDQLKLERDKVDKMADKLYDLGTTMVKANTEFKITLQSVEKDIDEIRRNQI